LIAITKNYKAGDILLEADLDAMKDSIEAFLNTEGCTDNNIAADSITASTKLLNASVNADKLAANAIGTSNILDANITLAKLADSLAAFFCPTGVTMAYGAASAPTGWLLCDGAAVSRATYASLFSVIGTSHGSGDGATTFHLPDYRGRFLRGVDNASAVDPDAASRTDMNAGGSTGATVGTLQAEATDSHNHSLTDGGHTHTAKQYIGGGGAITGYFQGDGFVTVDPVIYPSYGSSGTTHTGPVSTTTTGITLANTGNNETRPINAYVNFIIKT
jgi:microcystin-dependent protein